MAGATLFLASELSSYITGYYLIYPRELPLPMLKKYWAKNQVRPSDFR